MLQPWPESEVCLRQSSRQLFGYKGRLLASVMWLVRRAPPGCNWHTFHPIIRSQVVGIIPILFMSFPSWAFRSEVAQDIAPTGAEQRVRAKALCNKPISSCSMWHCATVIAHCTPKRIRRRTTGSRRTCCDSIAGLSFGLTARSPAGLRGAYESCARSITRHSGDEGTFSIALTRHVVRVDCVVSCAAHRYHLLCGVIRVCMCRCARECSFICMAPSRCACFCWPTRVQCVRR